MFQIGDWIQGPPEAVNDWKFKRKTIIGQVLEKKEEGFVLVEDAWKYKWIVDSSKVFKRKKPATQKRPYQRKYIRGGKYHKLINLLEDVLNEKMIWWTKKDKDTGEELRGHPMPAKAIRQMSIEIIKEHWLLGSISKAAYNPTRQITVDADTKGETKVHEEF